MLLLEKQIGNKENPLSIDDLKKSLTYNLKDFPQAKTII
jgi:hypothetical protein